MAVLEGVGVMDVFKWFRRDGAKKLRKRYLRKLEEALQAQRNGNIREYAALTAQAEVLREELEK